MKPIEPMHPEPVRRWNWKIFGILAAILTALILPGAWLLIRAGLLREEALLVILVVTMPLGLLVLVGIEWVRPDLPPAMRCDTRPPTDITALWPLEQRGPDKGRLHPRRPGKGASEPRDDA